jgi:hypothetical protein
MSQVEFTTIDRGHLMTPAAKVQSEEVRRQVSKRFKREMRERKAAGQSVARVFGQLWEELAADAPLPEHEHAELYHELLAWTKRWLK